MNPQEFERKLTAILSADVVGYSRLMGEDEELTIRTLTGHREMMATLIREHRGRVVDSPGDNLLAVFSSVTRAVDCAVEIQREMAERNEEFPDDRKMEYRIGVNLGDVIEEGDRIYGDGVNIAARLESLSEAGGICISGFVYNQVKNRLKLEYEFMGEQTVKNIKEPVPVYRVLSYPGAAAHRVIKAKKTEGRSWRNRIIIAVVALVVISATLTVWHFYSRVPSIESTSVEPEEASLVPDTKEAPKTIAVLPFADLSPESDQGYFVDGLSEEILNSLAHIPNLNVTGRTSSFSFKGTNKKAQEIADELGVDHILEGSVRKDGNALRITAQLLRGEDGFHLWSQTYDRELKDIFAVQEDIATAVADGLKLTLGIGKPLKQLGGTENIEAYELFLVAKGQLSDFLDLGQTGSDISAYIGRTQESLDAAIALDPKFALAWTFKAVAHLYHRILTPGYRFDSELDPGLNAALTAIELEPNLAEAHYSLGLSRSLRGEFIRAELAYRKAMELAYDPINCYIFFFYMHSLVVGYFERANETIEAARRIDPLNQTIYALHIFTSGLLGDVQRADEKYDHGRALFGDSWVWGGHFITLIRLGAKGVVHPDEIVVFSDIDDVAKEHLDSPKEGLAKLHQLYGDKDKLSESDITNISIWAAYFGDPEFAMATMEEGTKINATGLFKIWPPVMWEVRQLPRFKQLMREIGIVDYWNRFGWPDLCRPVGDDDFVCD